MEKQLLNSFPFHALNALLPLAMSEDLGKAGDITTKATIPEHATCIAHLVAKEDGIFCGSSVSEVVFNAHGGAPLTAQFCVSEGEKFSKGQLLVIYTGSTRTMLECERILLNFLQRLCGIATYTFSVVQLLKNSKTKLLDTRKTLPGYRELDKYAVRIGGGSNHRHGLFDQVLIKDNHIAACGNVKNAVDRCAQQYLQDGIVIEAEVCSFEELKTLIPGPVHWVLLDNMSNAEMKICIEWVRQHAPHILLEASGNMSKERISEIAQLGLDFISMGALTHSVKALDLSLQFQ